MILKGIVNIYQQAVHYLAQEHGMRVFEENMDLRRQKYQENGDIYKRGALLIRTLCLIILN